MPTLVFDPAPGAFDDLLAERERLGLDRRDEVWEGVLHMIPPPSTRHELLAPQLVRLIGPYAPDDKTWQKLGFYAAHEVDELLIVDPDARKLDWLGLAGSEYRPIERSGVLDIDAAELAGRIAFPD